MSTVPITKYVTAQQAALEIGVTDARVRQLIASGEIAADRAGDRIWLIERKEIERFKGQPRKSGRPRISD